MMRVLSLLAFVLLSADALRIPDASKVVTRRAAASALAGAAAAVPVFAAQALGPGYSEINDDVAFTQVLTKQTTQSAADRARAYELPAGAPGGSYADPMHPGCKRKLIKQGKFVLIQGADEDGVKWQAKAVPSGNSLLVDFSSKGGPKDVEGVWNGP